MSSSSEGVAVNSIASSLHECDLAANASHAPCIATIDRMLREIDSLRGAIGIHDDNDAAESVNASATLNAAERARVIESLKALFGDTKAKEFQRKDESAAVARLHKSIVEKYSQGALTQMDGLLSPVLPPEHVTQLSSFDHESNALLVDAAVTHLARSGRLDTAETLCRDYQLTDQLEQLAQFRTLSIIVSQLSERKLAPAIEWAEANASVIGTALVFQLHEVAFVELLCDEALSLSDRRSLAMRYGREHFKAFAQSHWKRVGYLFSAALFVDANANADVDIVDENAPQGLAASPYAALLGERLDAWQRAAVAVSSAFAKVCGIQATSALFVTTRCAWPVVPALAKLAALKRRGVPADASAVALPLASRERLHTVFACPVTRAQSAANNPPTMLPCRHVLAHDSAAQLVGRSGMIKCPYCPMQTTLANCKAVQF